jgi:hypothetical protein
VSNALKLPGQNPRTFIAAEHRFGMCCEKVLDQSYCRLSANYILLDSALLQSHALK